MWRAYDAMGFLQYSFADSVAMLHPYYVIRALGGVLYLTGGILMTINFVMTIRQPASREDKAAVSPAVTA
jgi:cytochrome c oxidase cbb3-type subunit 1